MCVPGIESLTPNEGQMSQWAISAYRYTQAFPNYKAQEFVCLFLCLNALISGSTGLN